MDFELNEEDLMLAETLRTYSRDRLRPDYRRWLTEPYPRERIRELGELGLLGITIPAHFGGSGGRYTSLGVAAEELARGDFNVTYFLQLSAIGGLLLHEADDDLKSRYLPLIASGDLTMAFALTEPGVGSDAASLATTAKLEGDAFVIRGEKASITFAGFADACVVFARTGGPGPGGISMFLVPLDLPGVSRKVYSSSGGHLTQRGSLFFDGVRVPASHQMGKEGQGFIKAMQAFDFNRAVIALACIGTAEQSLDETVEYAKTRFTFGRPLARHEAVAFQIAEHLASIHATRLVAYQTLALADDGRTHTSVAAMAKLLGPKQAADAIHACLILHGWSGYGTDLPFEQRLRDVIGLEVGDGTPEIMKGIIARERFGREFNPYRIEK